jgi:hypothetical protein
MFLRRQLLGCRTALSQEQADRSQRRSALRVADIQVIAARCLRTPQGNEASGAVGKLDGRQKRELSLFDGDVKLARTTSLAYLLIDVDLCPLPAHVRMTAADHLE